VRWYSTVGKPAALALREARCGMTNPKPPSVQSTMSSKVPKSRSRCGGEMEDLSLGEMKSYSGSDIYPVAWLVLSVLGS
jgi:hypothetical protein